MVRTHKIFFLVALVALMILPSASIPLHAASDKKPPAKTNVRENPVNQKLRKIIEMIDLGTFGGRKSSDIKDLKTLIKSAPDKKLKIKATSFLARHYLQNEHDPVSAAKTLLPLVVGREITKAWKAENKTAREVALLEYKENLKKAKKDKVAKKDLPKKPTKRDLYIALPALDVWQLNAATARPVLILALIHTQQKQFTLALPPIQKIGNAGGAEGLERILAAEAAGDLFLAMGKYAKATEFLELALTFQRRLTKGLTDYGDIVEERENYFGEDDYYKNRVQKKLSVAIQKRDQEMYGAAYVAFRRAERFRRQDRDFPAAYATFRDVEETYPQTVWSEASTAYRIKTLLKLATLKPSRKTTLSARSEELRRDIRGLKIALRIMQAKKVNRDIIVELEKLIADEVKELARLTKIPYGTKALKEAETLATSFLASNEFGLYRGETLIDLAAFSFRQELLPEKSLTRYKHAWRWLEEVEKFDKQVAEFTVPSKAKKVSAPPQEEKYLDAFGNVQVSKIRVASVLNRLSSAWYLDNLREQAALSLGFLRFYEKKKDLALAWYKQALAFDQMTNMLEKQGEWNDVRRLTWGAEHGYLYAFPKELRLYKKRQRFIVLVADYYYCTQKFAKASALAERLLAGEFGRLSSKQRDYPHYLLGSCEYWQGDRKAAFLAYEKVLKKRDKTYTELRAAFAAGKISWQIKDAEIIKRGHALLGALAKSNKKIETVYKAKMVYGFRLLQLGAVSEGRRILKSIPKEADGYREVARRYLDGVKRAVKQGKAKEKRG